MHARLQAYALTPTVARAASTLSVRRTALPGSGAESKRSYNDTAYNSLVSTRAKHILQLLPSGHVLYTDIDTVWLHDPIPYLRSPPVGSDGTGNANGKEVDLWLQMDEETLEATKAARMGLPPLADYYCTGFMALRSNERTVALMEAWDAALQGAGTATPSCLHPSSHLLPSPPPHSHHNKRTAKPQLNQPIFNRLLYHNSSARAAGLPYRLFPSGKAAFFGPKVSRGSLRVGVKGQRTCVGHGSRAWLEGLAPTRGPTIYTSKGPTSNSHQPRPSTSHHPRGDRASSTGQRTRAIERWWSFTITLGKGARTSRSVSWRPTSG